MTPQPIYFSKVQYTEGFIYGQPRRVTLLNLSEKTLSFQVIDYKRQMPCIQGTVEDEIAGSRYSDDFNKAGRVIISANTNFKPRLFVCENETECVKFSYGIKLTDEQIAKLLPYCNTLDFEPYRNREMSMSDEGFIGYRDEERVDFVAVTDSYIPLLSLPMWFYYDEAHIWPSEKLYRYLVKTFFSNNKKLRGWAPSYGGYSLFW